MARHFRTLRLDLQGEAKPWEETRKEAQQGILCLLTHESYLQDILDGLEIRRELLSGDDDPRAFHDQEEPSGPCIHLVAPLGLSSEEYARRLDTYMGRLRQACMNDRAFDKGPCILLARADLWDRGFQPDIQSPFLKMGGQLQAFLLWDDGGLWDERVWKKDEEARLCQAWRGSGWAETRIPDGDEELPFDDTLARQLDRSLEALARQLPDPEDRDVGHLQRALCRYLPRVRKGKRWATPFPNSPFRDPGRPRKLEGLPALDHWERLLLLDGWLTPWSYKGDPYVQPGSLALLYWAAKALGYDFTEKPKDFLDNYDWSAPEWFGGHLQQPLREP